MPTIRTLPRPVHRVIRSFSRRVASAFSFDFCCLPVVLLVLLKVQTCHRRWGFKFKHRVASRRLRSESTATVPRFPYPFVHRYPSMRSAQVQLSEVFAPSTMLGLFCVFVCLWEPSNWTAESPLLTHSHSYRLCLFNFRLRTKWAWADTDADADAVDGARVMSVALNCTLQTMFAVMSKATLSSVSQTLLWLLCL